jgi:electron transfer flavoprotein alpha subunit
MENARIIVSVNCDPLAPMAGFADHALVGDLETILPVLTAAVGEA